MKRCMWGSCDIYSVEYICTHNDIEVTTTNITTVKLSNKNPQEKVIISESNHLNNSI